MQDLFVKGRLAQQFPEVMHFDALVRVAEPLFGAHQSRVIALRGF